MSPKTPLQQVKEQHGGKEKLVDKLLGLLDRGDEAKDAFRKRLLAAQNSKLLRLYEVGTEVKELGGKEQLVDAILQLMNRAKDQDYRDKLQTSTLTRLLDLYRSCKRKVKAA